MIARIMGLETEYGLSCTLADGKHLPPDDLARALFRPIAAEYGATNIFVPNGSRLYLDVGAHPEWATAETTSVSQLIAYDRAGEQIFNALAEKAEHAPELLVDGKPAEVYLFKNNVDTAGNSYGCHENYLVGRELSVKKLGEKFLPFLVTRQLICGAGKLFQPFPGSSRSDVHWCLSQRADHVWEGVSSATTRSRPIINTRDEPHADSSQWRRLHVIVGDSTIAEPTTALKVGSTQLVLEMIEAGVDLPAIAYGHNSKGSETGAHTAVIKKIAVDFTGRTPVPLADGSTVSALELQRIYLAAAEKWLDGRDDETSAGRTTTNEEMRRLTALWAAVLLAIETGDLSPVEDSIDWMIKKKLIDSYRRKNDLPLSSPRLARLDLAYHDIRPGRGLAHLLVAKKQMKRWITDADILTAQSTPPPTTRAAMRGRFLALAKKRGAPVSADWMRLKLLRPEPQVVELGDPFATNTADYEALEEQLTRSFPA